MIKIYFFSQSAARKSRKRLCDLLCEKVPSETIHHTTWFQGMYLKQRQKTITIDVFHPNLIADQEMIDILNTTLTNQCSYVMNYHGKIFFNDAYLAKDVGP